MNIRWIAVLSVCLLAGCVSSDGSKRLKREDPTMSAAKTNIQLGVAYLQQGNYPLAREKLERSLKQNPKDPDVHTTLGLLYDRTGEPKLADKHYQQALKLAPEDPFIMDSMGWVLYRMGQHDAAITFLKRAFELRPDAELVVAGLHALTLDALDALCGDGTP